MPETKVTNLWVLVQCPEERGGTGSNDVAIGVAPDTAQMVLQAKLCTVHWAVTESYTGVNMLPYKIYQQNHTLGSTCYHIKYIN